jgi:hypothetical protein
MATFLVVLPGSSLGCLTDCLTFVYATLEIVKTKCKMRIIAAQSLNSRQPEQCRMLYNPCFFVFVFDVCLSANRKKLGGCFPLYSKDFHSGFIPVMYEYFACRRRFIASNTIPYHTIIE